MLKRTIDWHLTDWKSNKYRKPLLLRGARQVGKTHAIRKLGEQFDEIVEINFELAQGARPIFEKDLQPERIIRDLSFYTNQKIEPGKTLLFFDEIQEVPKAIIALRYFFEMMPSLHVIAAGSLFDFALEKVGIPVGRVVSMHMYPLSFLEFLAACGHPSFIEPILEGEIFSDVIHLKLMDLVGEYLAIGGMPEAVVKWVESKNPKECFQVHHNLITSYRQDFEKYAEKHQMKFVELLFRQIPHFIGKQFQYKNIQGEYRKRELAPCLDLLCKANVIHRIYHSAGNGVPLGAELNLEWFKIILVDIALSQALLGFDLSTWFLQPGLEFVNRGAIAEAFAGQELLAYSHPLRETDLFFWRRAEKSSSAEVDYLYEKGQEILPIEIKSGHAGSLKSLHLFLTGHRKTPYGIRFSAQNYSRCENIDSRPLYAIASLAHEDQKAGLKALF
jgi:predicted AAA+ superfamily ATPase